MERYIATQFYKADSPESRILGESGLVPSEFVLAADAQRALDAEREKAKQLGRTLADVYQQRDGLQAQLRQVEGERDKLRSELNEYTDITLKELTSLLTLRQLVAQLPVVDGQEVSVWLSPDESGWLVSKRPAFPAGLYWAKFRTQDEADSFRSLLAYRATLAAQDAPHPTEERS